MTHWTGQLVELHACKDAITWAHSYDTPEAAWAACPRGDWMLWLVGRLVREPGSYARRLLIFADTDAAQAAYNAGYASLAQFRAQCADIVRQHYPVCPLTEEGE